MTSTRLLLIAALAAATPAYAQQDATVSQAGAARDTTATADTLPAKKSDAKVVRYYAPAIEIQHLRANDMRGINVFESPKTAGASYTGFKLSWGGAFAQQFQNLTHQNAAGLKPGKDAAGKDVNLNALIPIGSGFNNAD
ncbi:MAG TPA: hypothetical protein VKA54_03505, partial [Gemmatimonadaceae bacterium]|nr:hypothetical protein [Gemmatimonadaceae bacterium]